MVTPELLIRKPTAVVPPNPPRSVIVKAEGHSGPAASIANITVFLMVRSEYGTSRRIPYQPMRLIQSLLSWYPATILPVIQGNTQVLKVCRQARLQDGLDSPGGMR